jgi:hypothetical protein
VHPLGSLRAFINELAALQDYLNSTSLDRIDGRHLELHACALLQHAMGAAEEHRPRPEPSLHSDIRKR